MRGTILLLTLLCCCFHGIFSVIWLDPDTGLNLYQFLDRHGYTFYENHTIVTQDNYILTTVRIPRGKYDIVTNRTKPVVLLLHGIWSNPQDFILKGDTSIGFLLAEEGFDVFLMASRGNTYSMGHKTFNPDSIDFWNFSWHEVGVYDIPANIDYITKLTGTQNVSFIGHSQGGTAFVAFAAMRPEYRRRVTIAHLFAPVVFMDHARLLFFEFLRKFEAEIEAFFVELRLNKGVFTYNPLITWFTVVFCNRDSPVLDLCVKVFGFAGPDPAQLNSSKITVIATNDPAGGSFKQVIHYLQVAKSSQFRLYDYRSNNILIYNQSVPPIYNLSSIDDIPLYVWYGLNDYFCGELDFQRLISEIPSAIGKQVSFDQWNHIDFVFGNDAGHYVYNEAISIVKSYFQ